ncbi:glutathione s-transferase II [Phlyctema vagabunda]|uniref:Glutathione s-transferase II n=1 Tax=Phlyctema vagabunda TaxID=108571 RepID=A0ABR4PBT3_9HELO
MFQTPLTRILQTTQHIFKRATPLRTIMTSSDERPTGLTATKGIELLTFGTPNGHKANIILEELKEAYGKEYSWQPINIGQNIQKEPWFTKINPNGRIPAIVDHDRNDFAVFEGAAILTYLTRHYDPEHKFSFADADDESRAEQWIAWQHGGLGPMQGQANHFYRLAKERIPYPTQRYVGETERLYGILDTQLKDRDYLVGPGRGVYSIADIASFSWVNVAYFAGVNLTQFPNLQKWWEKIDARPAVKKATSIPSESKFVNAAYQRRLQEEPEFKENEEKLKGLGDQAKKQYDYKFASP